MRSTGAIHRSLHMQHLGVAEFLAAYESVAHVLSCKHTLAYLREPILHIQPELDDKPELSVVMIY